MKNTDRILMAILVGLALGSAMWPGQSSASIISEDYVEEYIDNLNVVRFGENPTIEGFGKIDPKFQSFEMGVILSGSRNMDPSILARKKKVLEYYLPRMNAETIAQGNYYTFLLAVENKNAAVATDVFNRYVAADPARAKLYICAALEDVGSSEGNGSFDESFLVHTKDTIDFLLPLIAKVPRLSEQACELTSGNKRLRIPIGELVAKASPNFQQKLNRYIREGAPQTPSATSVSALQMFSTCTRNQITIIMKYHVMRIFSPMQNGGSQYYESPPGACLIRGIFKKFVTAQGPYYEFTPGDGRFRYSKEPFRFQTIEDLIPK